MSEKTKPDKSLREKAGKKEEVVKKQTTSGASPFNRTGTYQDHVKANIARFAKKKTPEVTRKRRKAEEMATAPIDKKKLNKLFLENVHKFVEENHELEILLKEEEGSRMQFAAGITYSGFDAKIILARLREQADKSQRSLISDVYFLSLLFHVRGTNVGKMADRATCSFLNPDVQEEVATLIRIYGIQHHPGGNPKTVTMSRISIAMPLVSLRAIEELIVTHKSKTPEEWLYQSNALPAIIDRDSDHYPKYIQEQAKLTRTISPKHLKLSKEICVEKAEQYFEVSRRATPLSEATQLKMLERLELALEYRKEYPSNEGTASLDSLPAVDG